jgi:hypothetical protein
MRTTLLKYALGAGLCGVLAFGAAAGSGQVWTVAAAPSQGTQLLTQFCVPALDKPDAHRFYCGNSDGSA